MIALLQVSYKLFLMMADRLTKYNGDICYLSKCSPKNRKLIINDKSSAALIKALGDVSHTIIKGKIKLSAHQKKEIKAILKVLQTLATKSVTIGEKKKLLVNQKGGAVLGLLFNLLKQII